MAIPLIAAAAAYGAQYVFASYVIGAFVGAVVTAGLAKAFAPKPKSQDLTSLLSGVGGNRTLLLKQPITSHDVVFGRVKKSGPMVFVHSRADDAGRADGYFYAQVALAGHHVWSVGSIYFNDDLSTAPQFSGLVYTGRHRGTDIQAEDGTFLADIGSPFVNHRLNGRANIAVRLKGNQTAFSAGIPNISVIVDGCDEIYDPRTTVTGFTNNAALCVAKWCTAKWGANRSWSTLDEPSVIAAANVCDERVLVLTGTTTFSVDISNNSAILAGNRSLDWGDGVRFTTSGTLPGGLSAGVTYYVIAADDGRYRFATNTALAMVGYGVLMTTAGTGTHTLTYYDEARYKINGSYPMDMPKGEVLDQLLFAMAGVRVRLGGKWYIHAGAAATPTVTLNEDDLRGPMSTVPKRSMRDRFNGVRAVFVNPDSSWQPVDAPPLTPTVELLAEDAEQELYEDIRVNFVTSARQVQRLMKIHLQRNRRQRTVSYPAKLTAMRLATWDGVYITNARYGWTQDQYRIMGLALSEDGGIDLSLQEDDADIYDWTAVEELPLADQANATLPDASFIGNVPYIWVNVPTAPTYEKIYITWPEVFSVWNDGYDVEHRGHGVTDDWTSYGRVSGTASRKADIIRNISTDFRARAVTKNGSTSAIWTENIAPGPPTNVTGGLDEWDLGTITWDNDPTAVTMQVFKDGALWSNIVSGPGEFMGSLNDGSYTLRSVNIYGNFSAMSAAVVITAVGAGGGGSDDGGSDDGGGGDDDGDDDGGGE